ncbi:MAG: toxin-antitoxin system HicB family antitoxin [Nitrospirae bacterium]|nr:toxin-antitoxin system HicB family antitoxin [Nitrospirota bacterium]
MKASDKYIKIVEWSNEDNCYVGSIPGFLGSCCHGDDEQEVYRQLGVILEEWIEIHESDGTVLPSSTADKEYSGKFVLRIDRDMHKLLAIKAMQVDMSLNQFCEKIIKNSGLDKKAA